MVAIVEQVSRDEWGRVLAGLIGFLGDFDLAEEAAQEAFAVAAERWPPVRRVPEPSGRSSVSALTRWVLSHKRTVVGISSRGRDNWRLANWPARLLRVKPPPVRPAAAESDAWSP